MNLNEKSLLLFKFSEKKWLEALKGGEVSFSCPGYYIYKAKEEGNTEQGDLYEGVFARLKETNPKIKQCQEKLGQDLEIIPDGDFVMLRRKSTTFIPTFCFYSFRGLDLLENVNHAGPQKVRCYFDKKIYEAFSSNEEYKSDVPAATLIIQPQPFEEQVVKAIHREGLGFEIRHIDYTLFENEEFYIEPTNKRNELFYKFPRFSYQKETRILLHSFNMNNIHERYSLNIGPLPDKDAHLMSVQTYFELQVDIVKN